MSPNHELLLPSPTKKATSPCKPLVLTLSLATLLCIATFLLTNLTAPDLCANSPDTASCHAIVASVALASASARPSPAQVLHAIVAESLTQHDAAADAIAGMLRRAGDRGQRSALADCAELVGLARDRVAAAAGATAPPSDARTWLSAALTSHATCLDGLDGPLRDAAGAHLEPLRALASASLAVLNSVDSAASRAREELAAVAGKFPSWASAHDRYLLEASAGGGVNADVVVAKDGSGRYRTVKEAVAAAPEGGKRRYVIYVKRGVYKEQVEVGKKKRNVMIVGDGMDATVITGSRNVVDGATTFNSATLAAAGDGIILQDLKIENTAGPAKHQAVALRVSADRAIINRCRIDGYQDTLYAHILRQFYRDTAVSGTIDVVFGNAAVVLQNCVLTARRPMQSQKNVMTAQGREDPNQNTGTSIQKCRVVPAPDLAPVEETFPTFLGRPWKAYSRTVYMQSYLGGHVNPKGWLEWDGAFGLRTLFYGEYQNQGPGAGTSGRVRWPGYHVITDASVASQFTVGRLLQGGEWLKGTGVAYQEGL